MTEHIDRKMCPTCKERRRCTARPANHLLHLVFASATFGIWIPAWVGIATYRDWRCGECGDSVETRDSVLRGMIVAIAMGGIAVVVSSFLFAFDALAEQSTGDARQPISTKTRLIDRSGTSRMTMLDARDVWALGAVARLSRSNRSA